MRNKGSHAPAGSIGDITGKAAPKMKGLCETCGAGLAKPRQRFCAPCSDARLQAQNTVNQRKARERKKTDQ